MPATATPLSVGAIAAFARDGFLVVEDVIDAATVTALRERLSAEQADVALAGAGAGHQLEADAGRRALRKYDEPAGRDPLFARVAATPRVLDLVAQLTGGGGDAGIHLYGDQVFLKPPRCGSAKPLHQDNSYFRIDPGDAGITCWIAIDDATPDNGCLRYVPGSHRLGLLPHKALTPAHLTPDVERALGDEVAVPVRAGGCILHHLLALHASPANASDRPRRAYALHYANRRAGTINRPWADLPRLR